MVERPDSIDVQSPLIVSQSDIALLSASGEFDPDFYLRKYPDVAKTGIDPAVHYLWIGARLGRLSKPPMSFVEGARPDRLDVLFVDGTNGTSSTPYRVDRVAEGLGQLGLKVECVRGDDLGRASGSKLRARFVTFFRAPLWDFYRAFAQSMRAGGAKIVFDIDDLVFDRELIPIIDGYRLLSEPEKLGYVRGVKAYRAFMLFADFCTAPTEFLAGRMRSLGKRAFRVRNTLHRQEIEKFTRNITPRADPKRFVIGYYSGSKTHQADFRNAGEALVQFMEECPTASFRLVGQFDLGDYPKLQQWSQDRVKRIELLPHSSMLQDQLECDLIIAPLEVGNPFCEAKSELKFFEASLARRPVIASPTETFREATRKGEYAGLADSPSDWLEAFRHAFKDAEDLSRIANRAHDYVVEEYSPSAAAADVVDAYSEALGGRGDASLIQSAAVVNSNPIG